MRLAYSLDRAGGGAGECTPAKYRIVAEQPNTLCTVKSGQNPDIYAFIAKYSKSCAGLLHIISSISQPDRTHNDRAVGK